MNFWNRFFTLCNEIGKAPNAVAKELGFSSGSVTWWKKGKVPQPNSIKVLADYFDVSVDYLLGNTDIKKENSPTEMSAEEQEIIEMWKSLPLEKREAFKSLLGLTKK